MEDRFHLKLGDILLKAEKISEAHLEEAMEKQRVYKRKIGEILVMMGLLNPEELDLYLLYQKEFNQPELHDLKINFELLQKIKAGELLLKKTE